MDTGQDAQQTIWIRSELHRALKIQAARCGVTLRALAEEAIQKYLEEVSDGGTEMGAPEP